MTDSRAVSDQHATPRSLAIANAGSGKTFTLANRILRWSVDELRAGRSPEPTRTLAVTFTRKAAGEILARILAHAAAGAAEGKPGDDARADFRDVVGEATREEYLQVLEALCRDLHRMQVGTIDGFFHRVATALPEEVGLPPEWMMGDERELAEIRAQVAAELLARDDAFEVISLLEEGVPKQSVMTSIEQLLGGTSITPLDMYRATLVGGDAAVARAWEWVDRLRASESGGDTDAGGEEAMEEFDALAERFRLLEVPNNSKGKPNGHWSRAIRGMQALLDARDLRGLVRSGFLRSIMRGGSYQTIAVPDAFRETGESIGAHVRAALLSDLARRMAGVRSVLPVAHGALERAQREALRYSFGDIGRGVARAAQRAGSRVADADSLREALGADIRDLAIDEAQDTSVEQYLAMRPLLADVLGASAGANGGRFLLVGDPKQSIYGWRGGTPGLIDQIAHEYAERLGPAVSLTKSYRSSPLVMDFVNRVFANLEEDLGKLAPAEHRDEIGGLHDWLVAERLPTDLTESAYARAAKGWRFAHHESARPEIGGRIEMYACGAAVDDGRDDGRDDGESPENGSDSDDAAGGDQAGDGARIVIRRAERAAAVAARLHREEPLRSIGILMRTNVEVADTIAELKRLGVRASDEGRSQLLDSPAVAGLVAMLQLADRPGDRIAHFLVSRGPMASYTGLEPVESHGSHAAARAAAEAFATKLRVRLVDEGFAVIVRELFESLSRAGLSDRDTERLARVVAIAEDLQDVPVARPIDLIDAIEADKADASSSDRVRVMTVHKSKGLEFDEVVVGSLDGAWGKSAGGWAMLSTDPAAPPEIVAPLGRKEVREWIPQLQLLERDERRRRVLDDISALYVALTRAKFGLHLVMAGEEKGEAPTAAKFIRRALLSAAAADGVRSDTLRDAPDIGQAFKDARADSDGPFWRIEYGELPRPKQRGSAGRDGGDASGASEACDGPLVTLVAAPAGSAAPPSSHATASLWQFSPFTDDDIALRGVLVHECFRDVRTSAEMDTAGKRSALAEAAAARTAMEKGEPVPQELVAQARTLLEKVAAGTVGRALAVGPEVEVRTELPFVREAPQGLVHGRIDRLELVRRGAKVVSARIVDYKTGAVGASGERFAEKLRGYFEQLGGYRDAVAELYSVDPASIEIVLLFVDRDEVVSESAAP